MRAALDQAAAEQRLGELIEEHALADQAAADGSFEAQAAHDKQAEFLVGGRVDLIVAEAATRKACG